MEYFSVVFQEVYKILFLLVPVLVSVAMIVWLDRRVWAFVQKRQGPNVVGPFGLLQSLADALKYIFKEIIIPSTSNKVIFILAPIVTMTLALISWAVIPFSATMVLADINVGILYLFAVSSLGVYGIIMGGCGCLCLLQLDPQSARHTVFCCTRIIWISSSRFWNFVRITKPQSKRHLLNGCDTCLSIFHCMDD